MPIIHFKNEFLKGMLKKLKCRENKKFHSAAKRAGLLYLSKARREKTQQENFDTKEFRDFRDKERSAILVASGQVHFNKKKHFLERSLS